jgi:hypothetical protein
MDGVADTIRFYFDGVEQPVVRFSEPATAKVYRGAPIRGNVGIAGPLFGQTDPFDLMEGIVDEFRIMEGVRGPTWVATEFRNQKNPAAFYALGRQETPESTAVHLQAFTAERAQGRVVLRWSVAGEVVDLAGFHVYRGADPARLERLSAGFVEGDRVYEFVDARPPDGGTSYWLAEVLLSGAVIWHGPAVLVPAAAAPGLHLAPNSPNPFARLTRIPFRLGVAEPVRLVVFDIAGRSVVELLHRPLSAGEHEVVWDGRDAQGQSVPAGVYFYRLESASRSVTRKLVRSR